MTGILAAWLHGVVLGLGVAAPLGPINIEIIRRHLGQGARAGLLLGFGACSVDTVYIVSISLLVRHGLLRAGATLSGELTAGVGLGGCVVLAALAGLILRSAGASARRAVQASASASVGRVWRHYGVGVLMTASSPMNLVFWLAVVASGQPLGQTALGAWPRVFGVLCGTAGWVCGLNVALAAGRRFLLRRRLLLAVNVASAGLLLGFAAWGVWRFAYHG